MMRLAVSTLPLILLAAAARSTDAQTVRGQMTDSIGHTPLRGAFITLVDAQGTERARTITNQAGEYILKAPAAGSYRLRSKRIGFHPYVSQALTLRAGETTWYQVIIDPIPVALDQVVVAGDRQCEVEGGASVAALWDEVREALAAVRWTRSAPGYWYEIRQFEREVFSAQYRPGIDSTWHNAGFYDVPFRSAPAEQLAVNGFVVVDDSGWTYFAPDADVLLSEPFLRTHCFETKDGRSETAGLVGLMFQPARGRKLSDIAGTLWVDRQTAELRFLEFKYIQLPRGLVDARAGGRVAFMRVPTGAWIVHEWVIRMPITETSTATPTGLIGFARAVGVRERGANAEQIKTSAGVLVFRSGSVDTIPVAATPPPPPAVAPQPAAEDTNRIRPVPRARSSDVLTEDEFAGSSAPDALRLVQLYRPLWLRSRGPVSVYDPTAGQVQVYVNGIRWGHVSLLRDIAAHEVVEMRHLSASEATSRYGANHAGPVIEVTTR